MSIILHIIQLQNTLKILIDNILRNSCRFIKSNSQFNKTTIKKLLFLFKIEKNKNAVYFLKELILVY